MFYFMEVTSTEGTSFMVPTAGFRENLEDEFTFLCLHLYKISLLKVYRPLVGGKTQFQSLSVHHVLASRWILRPQRISLLLNTAI